jgi:DNA repair protein RecN (Recombination protein N)
MLKELSLRHFVIAKSCHIPFGQGFNVLSGETGAGKTLLIQALNLLLGQKADLSYIRKGEEKATIQAVFESPNTQVYLHLQEHGVEVESHEELILLREINASGKHRIFINQQPISLPLLKTLAPLLVETISQHAQLCLKDSNIQRTFLDEYGDLVADRTLYEKAFTQENTLRNTLNACKEELTSAEKELPLWKNALEELSHITIEEQEEETLFQEYKKIAHLQTLLQSGNALFAKLSEDPSSVLERLHQLQKELTKLLSLDAMLQPIQDALDSAYETLRDGSFQLGNYLTHLEQEPERLQEIERQLNTLRTVKKKYGISLKELNAYKASLVERIEHQQALERKSYTLSQELTAAIHYREKLSVNLTEKRKHTATLLSTALTERLKQLNMHHALFKIQVEAIPPSSTGGDLISFYLAANLGEDFYPIKEHASGGELSRILFALKLLLAHQEKGKSLIFDEIDANIGGVTASILGKELKELGHSRQVICITHFPQVAAFADHHLQILKSSSEGRVMTEVKVLSDQEKKEELLRMLGGKADLFQIGNTSDL